MNRLCGFCRAPGHTVPKCPMREAEIAAIKTHVPAERKAIHDLLIANGYGVGALISAPAYDGELRPAVIETMSFVSDLYWYRLTHYKKVKYRNRDSIVLKTFTGKQHINQYIGATNGEVRTVFVDILTIPILFLHDTTRTYRTHIIYNELLIPSESRARTQKFFQWERHSPVLTPSYDTDATDDTFLKGVSLPDRISDSLVDGIKSW